MSVNWNNVINGMAKGKHPAVAFYEEEQRVRKQNRERYYETIRKQNEEKERRSRAKEQE